MAVNFSKNQDEITKAWKNVVDTKNSQSWALFGYEGNTNNIKLMSTGNDGLAGLVGGLNCSLIQYGFCRIIDDDMGINKLILINWQGDSSPLSRKGLCASHVADVTNYFKGCTQTITIRNDDEATVEYLMEQITKSSATSKINLSKQYNQSSSDGGDDQKIGSTYSRTNISSEIPADRKSFWQRQEEEEKQRLVEEKKRAAEKQAQFEKERKAKEETEAKKLAEAIKERDRLIDATRQAERRESSNSQASVPAKEDDDERVGRRSELLRLERNQETQSLIGKGLIKNKRAIFEQASQQQQQQQTSANNLPRKSSGTMVAQRLNSFKSLESSSSNNPHSIEKLSNGFEKQVSLNNGSEHKSIASEKVETIKITNEHIDAEVKQIEKSQPTVSPPSQPTVTPPSQPDLAPVKSSPAKVEIVKEEVPAMGNGQAVTTNGSSDTNGNSIHEAQEKTIKAEPDNGANDIVFSSKIGIKARAMYDYEAADDTEISFDPDDIIGFIEKVDPGWWHGTVVTGRFKNKSGLFPANHVAEL